LGLVNGFLGFDLSGENHDNVWYGVVAAVVFVAVVGLLGWKAWKGRRSGKRNDSNGVGMMALGDAEAKK
jgi:heme/copper-type cytochrome/quinol oxidase subunit 2